MSAIQDQIDTAIHLADRCKEVFAKEAMSDSDKEEIQTLCAKCRFYTNNLSLRRNDD